MEEYKLGSVEKASTNVLSMGLTVYKMFFGEEAIVNNAEEDYEIKIKGKTKGELSEKLKYFLSRCIKKNKRYTWTEFFLDDYLNFNEVNQNVLSNVEKIKKIYFKRKKVKI